MRHKGLCLLLALAACHTPPPEAEQPPTASRKEVTLALHRQLQFVLARYKELAAEDSREARDEQDDLVRLAAEIAVRIVRIDPRADIDGLVFQLGGHE